MYSRLDEVAHVLEKVSFTVDVVTQKTYGYCRGENYVYVNREAQMGRTALVIHLTLKERSSISAKPASDIKTCDHYQQFPLYLAGERHERYGIPHGFSSRVAFGRCLNGLFGEASQGRDWRYQSQKKESGFCLLVTADSKQPTVIIKEVVINRLH